MARAGQGEAGQDGADGAGTGLMDKADLKMLLKLSARRPVSCVVALTKDKQGIVLLHKRTRPRKLAAAAKQDARAAGLELDPASIRFGRASVDGASDSARVLFTVNRDAPAGMERAVKPVLKGVNFPRCAFVTNTALENELDDGEDPDDAADGPGEPGAAAPQAAAPSSGAASQQPTGGAANQQTANEAESQQPTGGADSQPPTGEAAGLQPAGLAANQQPANSQAGPGAGQAPPDAASGTAGGVVPPDAIPGPAAPARETGNQATPPRLPPSAVVPPDVARAVRDALAADPSRRPEFVQLLAQARAGAESGDSGAAEAGIAALRQAATTPAVPPSSAPPPAAPTPVVGPAPGPASGQVRTDADAMLAGMERARASRAAGGPAGTQVADNRRPGVATDAGGPGPASVLPLPALAGGAVVAGGIAAAPVAGGLGAGGSATAARIGAAVFAAAPEVALVVGAVVLVVWIAKYGPVKSVPVARFRAGTPGVAPISAEVNGTRHSVMLYHGPATSTPDLANQHSVTLRLGDDGVLTDRGGRAVARLGEGEVVPLPGVDIPGLFHGDAATPPVSEQPMADETPDGRRDGTGWVDQPPPRPTAAPPAAPPVPDLSGTRVNLGPMALSPPPPGLQGALAGNGGFTPAPPLPGLVPPPPVVPNSTANPAPPPVMPTSTATPVPDAPLVPPHTGGAPPVMPPGMNIVESQADPGLARPTGPIGGVPTGLRPVSEAGASPADKAQVDSELHVGGAFAGAGYQTEQQPTRGANAAAVRQQMQAEGLNPDKNPDLRVEGRIWDIYTPESSNPVSIRNGIARKISEEQTHRVAVDLRGVGQTEAAVRGALRANPVPDLKEIAIITENGFTQPFRP